jgi:hypothetical protein
MQPEKSVRPLKPFNPSLICGATTWGEIGMKSFLRENPTIAFGLGLPLLLVVVFLLISGIPALLVDPPQHDVLYATEYYGGQQGVQISVVDQKVLVSYRGIAQGRQIPRLWRYRSKTGAVQEIAIILPPGLASADTTTGEPRDTLASTPIDVPDLKGLVVDSSSIAPDGYEFSTGSDRYSGNIFGDLFYSQRYRHQATLAKDGRSIRVPNADNNYYRQNTRFIGWVVSP